MLNQLSKEQLLYRRLYISAEDFQLASGFGNHLLKKGWHFAPWERRHSTYIQQAAFTSAFVTAYARPFTQSRGWPNFPLRLAQYAEDENNLHQYLLNLRHQVYAHSDSSAYHVQPLSIVGQPSAILGAPFLRLTRQELQLALRMITKLQKSVQVELALLMSKMGTDLISDNPEQMTGAALKAE